MARQYNPTAARDYLTDWIVRDEGDESRAYCPLCEEVGASASPSASFNFSEGKWHCMKNDHGGSIGRLVDDLKANAGGRTIHRVTSERPAAEPKTSEPFPITEEDCEVWHEALLANEKALSDFEDRRGISTTTLAEFMIGWDGERYTFPVWDAEGVLVNVRRYRMGASSYKMLNIKGHGEHRIYGYDTLAAEQTVFLTAGETDRLLATQEGWPAVTQTAGEKFFDRSWGPLFAGKTVYVCYDADEVGRTGAEKVIDILRGHVAEVFRVVIPEVRRGYDLTDVIMEQGTEVFAQLVKDAINCSRVPASPVPTTGQKVSLQETMSEELQHKALEVVVSISGKQAEPWTAPRMIQATCDMNKGTVCDICPVKEFAHGHMDLELRPDDPDVFRFVDIPEARRKTLLKEVTGAKCTDRVEFNVATDYHVEELLVQPSIDERAADESQRPIRRTAYSVGTYRTGTNEKVRLVGHNVSDPKTGKLRFVAWQNEQVDMDIDKFELTKELREALEIFRPAPDQTALEKCLEIAKDMANNVTHIYGRDIVHVGYDIIWHSVLAFNAYRTTVAKGWVEGMAVGDTRTGKSEIAQKLIGHYRSGQLLSCEGATFAGLVGGVQQIDGRWHMTWGAIPMNDRRLVVLDEASGTKDANIIEQMSSIRSSGIAQITKISAEETSARTRLLWITNPADGSMLNESFDMGMAALKSVVPNNEDIARFDLVMALAKGEVDDRVINSAKVPQYRPAYSSEASEALVKWAWSLTADQIRVSADAEKLAAKMAIEMGDRYVADPPLVQPENVRFKLLRIACAIAARTFSISDDDELVVGAHHVEDAVAFLDEIYGSDSMGYLRKSRRVLKLRRTAELVAERTTRDLRTNSNIMVTLMAVGSTTFRMRDFQEFSGTAGVSTVELEDQVGQLIRDGMIRRVDRGAMVMSETLIKILRRLEDEDD